MSISSDVWIAVRPDAVERSNWEGDNIVFHGETGETHLLGDLPLLVLEILSNNPFSESELIRACIDHGNDELGLARKASRALEMLEEAELVERIAIKPR